MSKTLDPIDGLAWKTQFTEKPCKVSTLFYPFIRMLQILGLHPHDISSGENSKKGQVLHYEFRRNPKFLIFSLIAVVSLSIFLILLTAYALKSALLEFNAVAPVFLTGKSAATPINQAFSNIRNESESSSTILKSDALRPIVTAITYVKLALLIQFTFTALIHMYAVLLNSSLTAKYINNWSKFENAFLNIFPNQIEVFGQLKSVRNVLLIILPICLASGLAFSWTILFQTNLGKEKTIAGYSLLTIIVGSTGVILLITYDTIFSFMMCVSIESFKQINLGIRNQVKEKYKITMLDVQNWISITTEARNQMTIHSKIHGIHILNDLLIFFVFWCCTLFQSIVLLQTGDRTIMSTKMAVLNIIQCGGFFLRLLFKVYVTQSAINNEANLAQEVRLLESFSCDTSIAFELKVLIDMIAVSPSRINVVNLFTLNGRLLVSVVGQVATYLLVLLQFYDVKEK